MGDTVEAAKQAGCDIIIEPFNDARYYGNVTGGDFVSIDVFVHLWERLAIMFKDKPWVIKNFSPLSQKKKQ